MSDARQATEVAVGDSALVRVRVELFGTARLATGRREVSISAPRRVTLANLLGTLAEACPELVGKVILDDRSGLQASHILNLNGAGFVSAETVELKEGDSLLLFSSQAGG